MNSEFKAGSDKPYYRHMGNAEVRRHLQSLSVFHVLQDAGSFQHLLEKLSVAEGSASKER